MQARDYGCKVHQAKFILERLGPISIPRGWRKDKKAEATAGEKAQLRAVYGSLNWVCRETRPDVAAE
eukprot:1032026-Alexandrium_andersonii.AAC.1